MKILEKLWGGQTLTFEQFIKALGAASDIKLVNLADGGYVSKDKFDAKETELSTANTTIKTLQDTVRKFDGVDVEKLKNDAKNWETKYNDDIAKLRLDFAVETALTAAGSKNNVAVKALLGEFLKEAKLDDKGAVAGLSDEIKKLTEGESTSFMFNAPGSQQFSGMVPGNSGGNPPPTEGDTSKMSYSEFVAYQQTHPDATY
ncbi:MAG: phage scaffolding protein [Clostridia bacterium]|nr:phage scaffolding protein [Clostridia bacterium]